MEGGEGPYRRRPAEPDCRYYMSTGFCKFRTTCRFNHPLGGEKVAAKDEYPERLGQAECQHYLKTGFCKFGAVCKYHHPREKARSTSPENFNASSEIHTSGQEMTETCSKTMDQSEPTTQSAAHEVSPTGKVSCGTHNLGTSDRETPNAGSSSSFELAASSHDDVQTRELQIPAPRTKLERQIEASKCHWTELRSHSDSSGNGTSNREIYESLRHLFAWRAPEWFGGPFGCDLADMVMGKKLAEGGEAEIFEVKFGSRKPSKLIPRYVAKVFKAGYSLRDFETQWPRGLPNEENVISGMVMDDDRFAYLLLRKAIDLRRLIDVAQEDHFPLWNGKQTRLEHLRTYEPKSRSHVCSTPVFSGRCARKMVFAIAWRMMDIHSSGILHRDLKSSNVLCSDWKIDEDRGFSPKKWIHCEVADYETAIGVVGTGFWRAPEILLQLKKKNADVEFTKKADVYSFAMVCYEIFTGHVPFEGCETEDDVLNGARPTLPNHVPVWTQDLIRKCWHQDPEERPTFDDIWMQLLREDQYEEWKHIGYNPIHGPNISARVPLEGPENGGEDYSIPPSDELCSSCDKKRTHSQLTSLRARPDPEVSTANFSETSHAPDREEIAGPPSRADGGI